MSKITSASLVTNTSKQIRTSRLPTRYISSQKYASKTSTKAKKIPSMNDGDLAFSSAASTTMTRKSKATSTKPTSSTMFAQKSKRTTRAKSQDILTSDCDQNIAITIQKSSNTTPKHTETVSYSEIALNLLKQQSSSIPKSTAENISHFFQTGQGQYAEGDKFYGFTTPVLKTILKNALEVYQEQFNPHDESLAEESLSPSRRHKKQPYPVIPDQNLIPLLTHAYNEARSLGFETLVQLYDREVDLKQKEKYVDLYVKYCKHTRNWNVVDLSAYKLLGNWLLVHETKSQRQILYALAHSDDFWEQRVAVVSTLALIKKGQFTEILYISRYFLDPSQSSTKTAHASIENNPHNHLLHKAIGWMLREMGKVNRSVLDDLLTKNDFFLQLPTHTYSYCLEKHSDEEKIQYARKKRGSVFTKRDQQ